MPCRPANTCLPRLRAVWLFVLLLPGLLSAAEYNFAELDRRIGDGEFGAIKSLLIARQGELVFERYYRGNDEQTLFLVNSVTKSLGATLLGILQREGKLGVDESLASILSQNSWSTDARLMRNRDVQLKHLLTMRTGWLWDEWSTDYRDPANSMSLLMASNDWYAHVLRLPKALLPDEDFRYNTGVSTLMSAVVRAKSGLTPQAFAQSKLFEPLGIERFHVEGWSADGMGHGMTQFPFGEAPLGFAWWLRARDLMKLGELYRQGGLYAGRRLLDREWIIDAWSPHNHAGNSSHFAATPNSGYGYQWWLAKLTDSRGRSWNSAYANGWGRQYVLVIPDLGLTIVTTADDYDYDGPGLGTALRTIILEQFDPVLDERFSGSWFNPSHPGQGLQVEVLQDQVALYWFTYDDEGKQQWFVAQGARGDDGAELTAYRPQGGRFLQSDPAEIHPVGRAALRFRDCDTGALQFEIDQTSGIYELQRLTGRCASDLLPPLPQSTATRAKPAIQRHSSREGIVIP